MYHESMMRMHQRSGADSSNGFRWALWLTDYDTIRYDKMRCVYSDGLQGLRREGGS